MGTQLALVHSGIWPELFTDTGRTHRGGEVQPGMTQPNHVSGLQDLPYNLSRNGQRKPDMPHHYATAMPTDLPHELLPGKPGILPIPVTAYHGSWREEHTWGLLPSAV